MGWRNLLGRKIQSSRYIPKCDIQYQNSLSLRLRIWDIYPGLPYILSSCWLPRLKMHWSMSWNMCTCVCKYVCAHGPMWVVQYTMGESKDTSSESKSKEISLLQILGIICTISFACCKYECFSYFSCTCLYLHVYNVWYIHITVKHKNM